MLMTLLDGRDVSADVAVVDGEPRWWRHATGEPGGEGTFDHWTVHAAHDPGIAAYCRSWAPPHLQGLTSTPTPPSTAARSIIGGHFSLRYRPSPPSARSAE